MEVGNSSSALPQASRSKRMRPNNKEFQRAYKACIPCRKRKARCDVGTESTPPCARCRREHRECIFSAQRNYNPVKRQGIEIERQQRAINRSARGWDPVGTVHRRNEDSVADDQEARSSVTPPKADLTDSVIRHVVSSGNDALNILFEAVAHQKDLAELERGPITATTAPGPSFDAAPSILSLGAAATASRVVKLSPAGREVLKLWSRCRFVVNCWLSAEEAVTLIDFFFDNICPLSPVITNYYQDHGNHFQLLTGEPLLTSTLLMISSRYHLLPGTGAASRAFFMHERLWHHCQDLIQRVLYGQERSKNATTRTIGSIEALLLICEWHPRGIHFPPESEGWDASIYMNRDERDGQNLASQQVSSTSNRWLEEVIEPARRSDRMSWMLLGTALTLAYELGVFGDDEIGSSIRSQSKSATDSNTLQMRKLRVRKLLYVYINQLASRLGCSSMFPQNLTQVAMANPSTSTDKWQSHMSSWIELTKLVKSASELFFPSPTVTRQLLNSGRYSSLLDHFVPLLEQWRRKHLDSHNFQGPYQDTLFIEYHYARIYINSIGMEAVCQRASSELGSEANGPLRTTIAGQEDDFINEVIDGGMQILERTIKLAESDTLRLSPVRTFLRITTSSVFLIKAISLGVRNAKLQRALDTLDRSIQAMRLSKLDDMHLAARYATLLETHVDRLRHGFTLSSHKQSRLRRTGTGRVTPAEAQAQQANGMALGDGIFPTTFLDTSTSGQDLLPLQELSADDWLSLPFDPSMAPFGVDGAFGFPALDGKALDFIWNLPAE
jgi:Fungal Zn(2)-Cys(6) binuclear cluster domain